MDNYWCASVIMNDYYEFSLCNMYNECKIQIKSYFCIVMLDHASSLWRT